MTYDQVMKIKINKWYRKTRILFIYEHNHMASIWNVIGDQNKEYDETHKATKERILKIGKV